MRARYVSAASARVALILLATGPFAPINTAHAGAARGNDGQDGGITIAKLANGSASTERAPSEEKNWREVGLASWYGERKWIGQLTSSGARFDADALSAAHATLPMGTRVKVTLAGSARSVIVVINDRPGTRKRIIDLSRAAARELGILDRGVAVVMISKL